MPKNHDDFSAGLTIGQMKTYGRNCIASYAMYMLATRNELGKLVKDGSDAKNAAFANNLLTIQECYHKDMTPEECAAYILRD